MNTRRNKKLVYAIALSLMTGFAFADDEKKLKEWQKGDAYLQAQIDNIELTPGPTGPQGDPGRDATDLTDEFCALYHELKDGNLVGELDFSGICLGDYKYVFVTDDTFNGDMGGIDGADSICQRNAQDAGLPGEYKAWLASHSNGGPRDRFSYSLKPYVLPTEPPEPVAWNWYDLTDGDLLHSIDRNASGGVVTNAIVWSNVDSTGSLLGEMDCQGWTSSDGAYVGRVGDNDELYSLWTDLGEVPCDFNRVHLYCFGQ